MSRRRSPSPVRSYTDSVTDINERERERGAYYRARERRDGTAIAQMLAFYSELVCEPFAKVNVHKAEQRAR